MATRRSSLSRHRSRPCSITKDYPALWQTRYYDFIVYSGKTKIEKLRYMHRNPVTSGLVDSREQWRWSSYRYYRFDEEGQLGQSQTLPDA